MWSRVRRRCDSLRGYELGSEERLVASNEDLNPLASFRQFRSFTGAPGRWGPDESWRCWFGGGVLDGLVSLLDEHLTSSERGTPAAVGCVPWLTDFEVVARLVRMPVCVVV